MPGKPKIFVLTTDQYPAWNKFVDESPQGDVFCYFWWLDAVTKSRFKIYVVKEHDEIVAGMPLAYDKYGKINEPFLTRTLGILYKPQESASEHRYTSNQRMWANLLLKEIPEHDFIQTCTHHNFKDWLPYRWKGFSQTTRYTYIQSFADSYPDNLKKRLSVSCRNVISKAERNNIKAEVSQDFAKLYHLVSQSYDRQGLKFRISFDDFRILDDAIKLNGQRLIMISRDDSGTAHAGTYIVYNNISAYFLLSGSDPELRDLGGHTLAVWESVKYLSDKVEYFNFGGSDIRHIEAHIKGFGGVMTPYFHIYNGRQMHYLDVKYHLKSILTHTRDMLEALRLRVFSN